MFELNPKITADLVESAARREVSDEMLVGGDFTFDDADDADDVGAGHLVESLTSRSVSGARTVRIRESISGSVAFSRAIPPRLVTKSSLATWYASGWRRRG